jgi:UDP-N-acetylmuramate--alanine ligase
VRATLKAAKDAVGSGPGRVVVLFQPHRYTRTRDLLGEFAGSFGDADLLYLLDIYPAGERPIEGVDSGALIAAMRSAGNLSAVHSPDRQVLLGELAKDLQPHDLVLTLGAGDVWKMGEELLKRMKGA